jgi:hypothetical protein
MRLALAFLTGREAPRLDWLLDGLERQAQPGDDITLIVIDHALEQMVGRTPESIGYRPIATVTQLVHAPPKPTAWSGAHRITAFDWWSKANSANTALVLCPPDVGYIAFVDDRVRPGPLWLQAVRDNYLRRDAVLAGCYERIESAPDGGTKLVPDHRRQKRPNGLRSCGGGWLYGCTFALTLEWALTVNGFEEGCDALSGEDYIFGLMLGVAGYRIDFSADMLVTLDRTAVNAGATGGRFARTDKGVSPRDKSHAALERFGKAARTDGKLTPDLRVLRERWHAHKLGEATWAKPDPELRDWYDGERVATMVPR